MLWPSSKCSRWSRQAWWSPQQRRRRIRAGRRRSARSVAWWYQRWARGRGGPWGPRGPEMVQDGTQKRGVSWEFHGILKGFSPAKIWWTRISLGFMLDVSSGVRLKQLISAAPPCGRVGWVMTPLLMGYDMWIYVDYDPSWFVGDDYNSLSNHIVRWDQGMFHGSLSA